MKTIVTLTMIAAGCVFWTHRTEAEHRPDFRWVEGGATGKYKTTEYDNTLYDGDEPIGYFLKKTLTLREHKLLPGILFGKHIQSQGIGFYAQDYNKKMPDLNVKDIRADDADPTRFVMTVRVGQKDSREKEDNLDIETSLEVTWDKKLKCYAWTVTKKITILGGRVLNDPYIEFENTYFQGHYAVDQRYQYYVWKARDGNYYKNPFNHAMSMDLCDWVYAEDGFWVACLNKESNPAMEWLGGPPKNRSSGSGLHFSHFYVDWALELWCYAELIWRDR